MRNSPARSSFAIALAAPLQRAHSPSMKTTGPLSSKGGTVLSARVSLAIEKPHGLVFQLVSLSWHDAKGVRISNWAFSRDPQLALWSRPDRDRYCVGRAHLYCSAAPGFGLPTRQAAV